MSRCSVPRLTEASLPVPPPPGRQSAGVGPPAGTELLDRGQELHGRRPTGPRRRQQLRRRRSRHRVQGQVQLQARGEAGVHRRPGTPAQLQGGLQVSRTAREQPEAGMADWLCRLCFGIISIGPRHRQSHVPYLILLQGGLVNFSRL